MTFLSLLTDEQIRRIACRLYARICEGGGMMFGADWVTLRITNPGLHNSYRLIVNEMNKRRMSFY